MLNIFSKDRLKELIPQAQEFFLCVLLIALTFSTALAEIALVSALVLWIIKKFYLREPLFEKTGYNIILFAFFILCCLSLIESENIFVSLRGVLKLIRHLLIFFMVVDTYRTERQIVRLVKVICVGWIVILLDGIWQYHYGWDLLRNTRIDFTSSHIRVCASMKHFGIFATFLIMYIPLFMIVSMSRAIKWKKRFLTFLLLLLSLILLYWTYSRGAWLACLVAILFFGIISGRKLILPIVVVGCLIAVFFMPRSVLIHLDAESKEQSVVERFVLWQRAIDVIEEKPLLGIGINTYDLSHAKYDKHKSWRVREYYAHNGYLQMAAETGLISLALFLAFLLKLFMSFVRSIRKSTSGIQRILLLWLATGLTGFLAFAMVDTIMHNNPTIYLFWFMCGLAVATMRLNRPATMSTKT